MNEKGVSKMAPHDSSIYALRGLGACVCVCERRVTKRHFRKSL